MTEPVDLLRSSWKDILRLGEIFPRVFYEVLFDIAPEAKALFPVDMRQQRLKLMQTLAAVVHTAHDLEAAGPQLRRLGRDHVRYGAGPDHYPAVGSALLFTAQWLPVPGWTPERAEVWVTAYGAVSAVMIEAAKGVEPPMSVPVVRVSPAFVTDHVHLWIPRDVAVPPGPQLHVARSDRVGEWLSGWHGAQDGELVSIEVDAPNTPAGWGIANFPVGDSDLRLAPVFEETDHA